VQCRAVLVDCGGKTGSTVCFKTHIPIFDVGEPQLDSRQLGVRLAMLASIIVALHCCMNLAATCFILTDSDSSLQANLLETKRLARKSEAAEA
jgi:hypothetical protein